MINTIDLRESYRWSVDPVATGKALLSARNKVGLSRDKICDIMALTGVDITPTTLYYWETGKRVPRLDHIFLLACIYRTSLDQLVIGFKGFRPGAEETEDPAGPLLYLYTESSLWSQRLLIFLGLRLFFYKPNKQNVMTKDLNQMSYHNFKVLECHEFHHLKLQNLDS